MTHIRNNYSLKEQNTFGLEVYADQFIQFSSEEEIIPFFREHKVRTRKLLILGEGSNILFTGKFTGQIIHPNLKGVQITGEDRFNVNLDVGCGENWDDFVEFCVNQGFSGLENLSLIPGSVGAAPVQNIGAYGVEVKDRINYVEGFDLSVLEKKRFFKEECEFDYRQSIFKKALKNRFMITRIGFRLDKHPKYALHYGNLERLFSEQKEQNLKTLRKVIIEIRESKLPDPGQTGNAGSFFKNPVIPVKQFGGIRDKFPSIPSYPSGDMIKIPAAWLIEEAGWKGVRVKDVGTWPSQPLVVVNYGNATGKEILDFTEDIRESVKSMFNIELEREVNVL